MPQPKLLQVAQLFLRRESLFYVLAQAIVVVTVLYKAALIFKSHEFNSIKD
jgi:hypothetical protein